MLPRSRPKVGHFPRFNTQAAFLSALADSCGYVATVSMYLGRSVATRLLGVEVSYTGMLVALSLGNLVMAPLCALGCAVYYRPYLREVGGARAVALKEGLLPPAK